MISNQILQSTIDGLKTIARVDLGIVDVDGKMIASTSESMERCANLAGVRRLSGGQPGGTGIPVFQDL